ncbi:MAG: hypothetical protein ACJAVV_003301 [Alphaproteobacteria bacterium]|jgi:hypothetical protein
MIKLILRLFIEASLLIGGSAIIWQGLSNSNDIIIFLGVVLVLVGVALARCRFFSGMWLGK